MKNLLKINLFLFTSSSKKLIFVFILLLILPFSGCKSVVKETDVEKPVSIVSPLIGQSEETCYVVVDSSEHFNSRLISKVSISLISQYVKNVKNLPPEGAKLDSCIYEVSVNKIEKTTIVTLKGDSLNSYGNSKLSGIDGFQQSIIRSFYRSLPDTRERICLEYGYILEECGGKTQEQKVTSDVPNKETVVKQKVKVLSSLIKKQNVYFMNLSKSSEKGINIWVKDRNKWGTPFISFIGGISKGGLPNGPGIMKSIQGSGFSKNWIYEGNMLDGNKHGLGKILFSDGYKIEGEWRYDKDWNTIEYDNKGNIIGEWTKGKYKFM